MVQVAEEVILDRSKEDLWASMDMSEDQEAHNLKYDYLVPKGKVVRKGLSVLIPQNIALGISTHIRSIEYVITDTKPSGDVQITASTKILVRGRRF